MTDDRFAEILNALRWGERTLAVALDEHWKTVRRWRQDPSQMPPNVEQWLESIASPLLAQPQPEGWADRLPQKRPAP